MTFQESDEFYSSVQDSAELTLFTESSLVHGTFTLSWGVLLPLFLILSISLTISHLLPMDRSPFTSVSPFYCVPSSMPTDELQLLAIPPVTSLFSSVYLYDMDRTLFPHVIHMTLVTMDTYPFPFLDAYASFCLFTHLRVLFSDSTLTRPFVTLQLRVLLILHSHSDYV
jgi:hypothetical protein